MSRRAPGAADRAIAERAASRNRVVTRDDLRAAGLGSSSIGQRLAIGRLHRIHRGVYLLEPPETASRVTLLAAAVYACGAGAMLSHRSAAEVWGLLPAQTGDIHVTVLGRNPGVRRKGICVHRPGGLHARDIRTAHRIGLTSPPRTVLDVASELPDEELELLIATAHIKRLASEREIILALGRYPSRPGARRVKAILGGEGGAAFTRSRAERRMLRLLRAAQLPIPEVNVKFRGYTLDFLWRDERLVVETDGYQFHSDRAAFERDRGRDATLVAEGFRVMRVTWLQLRDQPMVAIARIARALVAAPR